jgi:hypothetical protein
MTPYGHLGLQSTFRQKIHLNMNIKYIIGALFLTHIFNNLGLAQSVISKFHPNPWPENSKVLRVKLPDLGESYLILTPDLAKASLDNGRVTIPFTVTNNSTKDIEFTLPNGEIAGLAKVEEDGKKMFIDGPWGKGFCNGSERWFTLKPRETNSLGFIGYPMDGLAAVTGKMVFGVIRGRFVGTTEKFFSYSAPFLVPPELTTLPYNDLGTQASLSITLDLTKVGFTGGTAWIPITVTNTSNQDLIAANDEIRFYIAGDESKKNAMLRDERWEYLKTSTPILKPGESCESTDRDCITLSFLEDDGYKPGDKIIAVVGGRIPGTNNIFECYSAPFELPPLPKGEPPAGK